MKSYKNSLTQFDDFFSRNGYEITRIENDKPFWKLSDEYRLYIKGDILCILTNDMRERFLSIEFYLIKLINDSSFSFYYVFTNGSKFIDKSISLHQYKSNSIDLDLLYYKNDSNFLISKQIDFLANNLIKIEKKLIEGRVLC